MTDFWRELLYPLGFLSAFAFSARMLLQWAVSEAKGKSIVMPAFWKLSLCGNCLLALHALIQVQFHVCLIQVCNGVISWRNLNLMQPLSHQIPRQRVYKILFIAITATMTLFWLQGLLLLGNDQDWFRIPAVPWQSKLPQTQISSAWHIIGFLGLTLFNSRFWIQWWCAEKYHLSYLGKLFWWISLSGETLCLVYFLRIGDPVNFIGPLFGIIPYIRNIMLIKKQNKQSMQDFG